MWEVRPEEVLSFARASGEDRFVWLVDSLIRAHAAVNGLAMASVLTNLRTKCPDGGVDTQVTCAAPNDDTGWMGVPTVWQYKARAHSDIDEGDLVSEINKWYASQCIKNGYAYRFCICDQLPPCKKLEWKAVLDREARRISVDAPEAHVITADDLAAWLGRFPALILCFFVLNLRGFVLTLRAGASLLCGLRRRLSPYHSGAQSLMRFAATQTWQSPV